jgi:hypothetical protein
MQVKGRTFTATMDYISKKFSREKISSFFTDFPEFSKITGFSDIDWYPMDFFLKFSEKIDKFFGFGDSSLLIDIGAFSALRAFETSHKLFKNLTPRALVSNIQTLLSSYYSSGKAAYDMINDNKMKIYINDFVSSPFLVKRIQGWISQALKLTGAKEVHVHDIKIKNADICFNIEWC